MNRYFYDLHIHSCLSPCGDDDMTVNNIAGMASLKGLNIIALTDHNTCKNCPAFFKACKAQGIIPVAGMELTTSEEIHLVCLFESLEEALDFEADFEKYRLKIKNKPEIFGNQYILDENDEIIGKDDYLLPPATSLSLEAAYNLAVSHNGFCYPAHIDRPSNGLIGVLGSFPDKPHFNCAELSANASPDKMSLELPELDNMLIVKSSDAHYLWDISEAQNSVILEDEPYSGDYVRKQLFNYLKGNRN